MPKYFFAMARSEVYGSTDPVTTQTKPKRLLTPTLCMLTLNLTRTVQTWTGTKKAGLQCKVSFPIVPQIFPMAKKFFFKQIKGLRLDRHLLNTWYILLLWLVACLAGWQCMLAGIFIVMFFMMFDPSCHGYLYWLGRTLPRANKWRSGVRFFFTGE